jgi:exopolysaccharide biosynthesis protein
MVLASSGEISAQLPGFKQIKWKSEKIAPGLRWKSAHSVLKDTVPQNINLLIINTRKRQIALAYNEKENIIVSRQATEKLALAAVNGGFFNIKEGGSVTYIKTNGLTGHSRSAKPGVLNSNMNGSVVIDRAGMVTIESAKSNDYYDSHADLRDVLVTGPLLVNKKKKLNLPSTSLVENIHPRTTIGKRGNHLVMLVTVDGRTQQARGMTLSELSDLMVSLHCKGAVNLDGGGSTTMWISGKPFNGVVNMPCDNKIFDHFGERAVSDILIVK